jgi:hypothetical protein
VSGPAAAPAGPVADDLAIILVQATASARDPAGAAGSPNPGKVSGEPPPAEGPAGKTVSCDDDPGVLPDEAAASAPAPDPSLALAAAVPAPPLPSSTPAAAPGAEEAAPGVTALASAPGPAMPAAADPAPDTATAVTAETVPLEDRTTRSGPAREDTPGGQGNAALAKSAPGAASFPVRQDGAHELPATASDVAVARAGGAPARGRDVGVIPGLRNGGESTGVRPAEPEPGKLEQGKLEPGKPEPGKPEKGKLEQGKPEQAVDTPPADPAAATASEAKAVPAHGPAEGVAREDKITSPSAARETAPAEAVRSSPVDPAPASVPSHSVPHPARAAEAGPARALPGQALSDARAAVPVVPNVPLAAEPVEIGLRSLSGLSRFEIRLEPEDLGRIDVRLDIDGDRVEARLVVDRAETLALLQRDARTLERAFEQAGLKPSDGGIDLSLRDPHGDARGQRRGDDRPGRAPPDCAPPPATAAEPAAPRILRTLWRTERRLDLRI